MTQCIESDGNELYIGDDPYWRGRALKAEAALIELRAEKAEGALRSGLSYEELCGAFDALTQLYEAAVARAKAEEHADG